MNKSFYIGAALLLSISNIVLANDVTPSLVVLGVAQDAGYPQAGCYKPHCLPGWRDRHIRRYPVSLGLIDPKRHIKAMFEATPGFPEQLYTLNQMAPDEEFTLSGIFLTHAHIGHYAGLMYLGHEAMGTKDIPVFVMPRMRNFLSSNGPWEQLVKYGNIKLEPLEDNQPAKIGRVTVTPFLVPHRDEYSETVGYRIQGPEHSAVFIPDINQWSIWETDLVDLIASVDYALLDASFYAQGELPGRDMSKVPHPLVTDTMARLSQLPAKQRDKVWFIHFNHTNPLLNADSEASKAVSAAGFNIAYEGLKLPL